jgi:hypothetical protein
MSFGIVFVIIYAIIISIIDVWVLIKAVDDGEPFVAIICSLLLIGMLVCGIMTLT